ncbi:UNVERIFIED_ORG: hypothetical protein FNL38_11133 [Nocardia globerula]|uniref:Uncharacterized protein n=1 Tax=Nocardia globerula TaxID=1818 RepID=A0A652YHV9_NOCGL
MKIEGSVPILIAVAIVSVAMPSLQKEVVF